MDDKEEGGIEVLRRLTDVGGVRVLVGVRTPSNALFLWFDVELALLPLLILLGLFLIRIDPIPDIGGVEPAPRSNTSSPTTVSAAAAAGETPTDHDGERLPML